MVDFDAAQEQVGNIGRYQLLILFATQLGYICVAGSMLATVFDSLLPEINCTFSNE